MTWFHVAAMLGVPVAQAQALISPTEFGEWRAWFTMEPRGDARADYHAALIAGNAAHAFGGGRWQPKDYVLKFDRDARQTPQDMEMIAKGWATTHNARLKQQAAKERE